jgi:hypothetical protein
MGRCVSPPADLLLSAAAPSAEGVFFPPPTEGAHPSAAVLEHVFTGGLPGPGWIWGSDLIEAFLRLTRKDTQGTTWNF